MKHAFIINPIAGTGRKAKKLYEEVQKFALNSQNEIEVHLTTEPFCATKTARKLAIEAEKKNEEICIYACGGDGTLNEVANGVYGYRNVILGVVPVGSGNDFIRNFNPKEGGRAVDFTNIEAQLKAEATEIDVLEYSYNIDGERIKKIGLNAFNIGFDGNVAILGSYYNKNTFISGSLSYLVSILVNIVEKSGQNLNVKVDGEQIFKGPLLLCTIANGRFCGGGIESSPRAELCDGFADVLVISKVSRRKILKLLPGFAKGKIFELKDAQEHLTYRKGHEIEIIPRSRHMKFVIDGEIMETDKLYVKIKKQGMRVLVPYLD